MCFALSVAGGAQRRESRCDTTGLCDTCTSYIIRQTSRLQAHQKTTSATACSTPRELITPTGTSAPASQRLSALGGLAGLADRAAPAHDRQHGCRNVCFVSTPAEELPRAACRRSQSASRGTVPSAECSFCRWQRSQQDRQPCPEQAFGRPISRRLPLSAGRIQAIARFLAWSKEEDALRQ